MTESTTNASGPLGLDPQLVFQTLQATNAVVPAGAVETSSERVAMRERRSFSSSSSRSFSRLETLPRMPTMRCRRFALRVHARASSRKGSRHLAVM